MAKKVKKPKPKLEFDVGKAIQNIGEDISKITTRIDRLVANLSTAKRINKNM